MKDQSGAVMMLTAMGLTVFAGFAALAVEVGSWYVVRRHLQTAADAASIAGVLEQARGSPDRIVTAARQEAVRNGFLSDPTDVIAVNHPPTEGALAGNVEAVETVVSKRRNLVFSSLFLSEPVTIRARSVAGLRVTGQACVLALDHTTTGAVTGQGSTVLNLPGCTVASNSVDPVSIDFGGSASLRADSMWAAGGVGTGGSSAIQLSRPAVSWAWRLADPYKDLTVPTLGACTANNLVINSETRTLSPGVYCGGLRVGSHGVAILRPGTYYINRGDFEVGAQGTVRCDCTGATDGVTIVLTSSSATSLIGTARINGGAIVDLRAPSDAGAPYRGVAFYRDRRGGAGDVSRFNGGAAMQIMGAVYMPSSPVNWSGNAAQGSNVCTQVVARTVVFTGDSRLEVAGCSALGVRPINTTLARVSE